MAIYIDIYDDVVKTRGILITGDLVQPGQLAQGQSCSGHCKALVTWGESRSQSHAGTQSHSGQHLGHTSPMQSSTCPYHKHHGPARNDRPAAPLGAQSTARTLRGSHR